MEQANREGLKRERPEDDQDEAKESANPRNVVARRETGNQAFQPNTNAARILAARDTLPPTPDNLSAPSEPSAASPGEATGEDMHVNVNLSQSLLHQAIVPNRSHSLLQSAIANPPSDATLASVPGLPSSGLATTVDTNVASSLLRILQGSQTSAAGATSSLLGYAAARNQPTDARTLGFLLHLASANQPSNLSQPLLQSSLMANPAFGSPHSSIMQQLSANPALANSLLGSLPLRGTAGSSLFNLLPPSIPPNLVLSLLSQPQLGGSNLISASNTAQLASMLLPSLSLTGASSMPTHPTTPGTLHHSNLAIMELLARGHTASLSTHAAVAASNAASMPSSASLLIPGGLGTSNQEQSALSRAREQEAAAAAISQEGEDGGFAPSDSDSILVYAPADDTKLSPYQCLARQQLEFFIVKQEDLEAGAQGRNRPIVLGQVGVRCRHCAQVAHRQKERASAYFPAKLSGVYQTAQNITNSHMCQLCHCIPPGIRRNLQLLQSKKSGSGGGRKYWSESADVAGICEVEGGGLRFQQKEQAEEKSTD